MRKTFIPVIIYSIIFILFSKQNILALNHDDYIETVLPSKSQKYIVSKPSIIINLKSEHDLDMSSTKVYVNYENVTSDSSIGTNTISYTPSKKFKRGNQVVKIEIDKKGDNSLFSYEWYFNVGSPIYNHYYGLLHAHTDISDGSGDYEFAYTMARDDANLDFFSITEHSHYFDNDLKCSINNGNYSSDWSNCIKSSDNFTKNESFIALPGFEMTYNHNLENKIGHINIFNSDGFISRNDKNIDLNNFYHILSQNNHLIGQFNHPGDRFGDFNALEYNKDADKVMTLLEVRNGYSSNMKKNIKSYDMYQLALDNGWHVAPTSNQDNHKLDFGLANEFRTVVVSTSLTKESILDALKNMRVYATEDKNIKIDYSINNNILGSTIKPSSKLNFLVNITDLDEDDKINEVQIISNNSQIIKSKKFNSNIARLEFTLKSKDLNKIKSERFFYVKVIQNNKTSVTAPIWIKK